MTTSNLQIIKNIYEIYKKGNLSYLMESYVNKNHWNENLSAYFKNNFIENMTDFNYAKCFSLLINISDTDASLATEQFEQFIQDNQFLYRLEIHISLVGPYVIRKYIKYFSEGTELLLEASNEPYLIEHAVYEQKFRQFVQTSELMILEDDILRTEIQGITLELNQDKVSVYNCLFEDGSYFPY